MREITSAAGLPRWLSVLALALPIALVVGVLIAAAVIRDQAHPAALPLASVPAPAAGSADCRRLLSALPDELDGDLARRQLATPAPPAAAAWGDPPVVLRCGVARPAGLTATARLLDVSGVQFLQLPEAETASWAVVDRSVYVVVAMPVDAGSGPLQHLAEVVADILPRQDPDLLR